MDGTIIIADDDKTIRTVLSQALIRAGARVRATSTTATLWNWVEAGEGDVVVTDVMMPDGDALDLLPRIKAKRPDLPVIVMSAQNTVMTAIRASEAGAFDYLPKPFDLKQVLALVNKALQREVAQKTEVLPEATPGDALPIVGSSPAMQEVYRLVARLVNSNLNVLITGESGTGKDLVARVLHDFGSRKSGPFIELNLGAMSSDEIDDSFRVPTGQSELPMINRARGGTLFLNEVGDLSLDAQTRLLRLLQDLSNQDASGDVRIIAATHNNLAEQIEQGAFREDLFYRLNVVPIRLPALRERVDDIADLVRYFLKKAANNGLPLKTFSRDALNSMRMQSWYGNVRELENLVNRIVVLVNDEQIGLSALDAELSAAARRPSQDRSGTGDKLADAVQIHLQRYFVKTAEMLGINRNTLRKKIKDLDIRVTRGKKMM